jgi:hypothetical protein
VDLGDEIQRQQIFRVIVADPQERGKLTSGSSMTETSEKFKLFQVIFPSNEFISLVFSHAVW